ncbi:hypothetical protein LMG27198_44360 [Methylocystis echinoides]|uniref:Uncharacterized protein n=1 Tax=Methylocystis echinoides TaxID=29468 RepID=A0A9W6GYS1_9HYPH|nr:hypothetical protein LMG27198_44360 [Methylocystis echinoides]
MSARLNGQSRSLYFLYAKSPLSVWPAYGSQAHIAAVFYSEPNMLDLIYLVLGVVILIMMGFYARACGRL